VRRPLTADGALLGATFLTSRPNKRRRSYRHRHRATRGHRGPGAGADRPGHRWAGRGYCRRWSRHRQRARRGYRSYDGGADRHDPRWPGSSPLPPPRLTALRQFRRDLRVEAWCAAGITAVRHEDCGPLYTAGRHDGGACRRQSSGSARGARRQSRRHAAGCRQWCGNSPATLARDAAVDEYREAIVRMPRLASRAYRP
jgi:hypothetical protein